MGSIPQHPPAALLLTSLPSQAEFEGEIIRERTKAGLEAAKARGRSGGRPGGLSTAAIEKAKSAKLLQDSGTKTAEIAKILGISRATCYRYIEYAAKLG
jgi:DNA invertase Pin-like site-specific DNA recombinase